MSQKNNSSLNYVSNIMVSNVDLIYIQLIKISFELNNY